MSQRRSLWLAWALLLASSLGLIALAASHFYPSRPSAPPRPSYTGEAALVERFQCYRCHDAPGKLVPAVREKHCVRCHQAVHAGDFDSEYSAEKVAGWKEHLVHLRRVPSLAGVERLRRDWLLEFLQAPHDLRPGLEAEMPRLAISPAEARSIVAYFAPAQEAEPAVALGDPERGRVLFRGQDCAQCHHFSGSGVEGPAAPPSGLQDEVRLAPDLRHTRRRMSAGAVLAWLRDPQAVKADTLMPTFPLSDEQRKDLAAFVLQADLAPITSRTIPARLPLLERAVSHAEVERRVFKRICWHCHSDPIPVGGDGGPGNTGGFGFAGKGLDLGSYAAIKRGGHGPDGLPVDYLAPDAEGVPRIVAAMHARYAEVAGETRAVRGMPLGLPPMSLEEIQLVETWIAQGAPE
jgi:mono/diheme cytochrome c family protein